MINCVVSGVVSFILVGILQPDVYTPRFISLVALGACAACVLARLVLWVVMFEGEWSEKARVLKHLASGAPLFTFTDYKTTP